MRDNRHPIPVLTLAMLILASLACNLVSAPESPLPYTATPPAIDTVPTVNILWPPNGSEFVQREEVTVRVQAADDVGITRIELRSASAVLSSVPSPDRDGQTTFDVILSWRPTRSGQQDLEVVAYRRSTASLPFPLTVVIRQRPADLITTPVPFDAAGPSDAPQPSASCQVRVDIDNLRFRAGPGTTYEILGILDLGETLFITGQDASGGWWRITRSGQVAWVSSESSYSTELTNCAAAPVSSP
jgi:uncharacterized protein YgiM (DUF1202 family)